MKVRELEKKREKILGDTGWDILKNSRKFRSVMRRLEAVDQSLRAKREHILDLPF